MLVLVALTPARWVSILLLLTVFLTDGDDVFVFERLPPVLTFGEAVDRLALAPLLAVVTPRLAGEILREPVAPRDADGAAVLRLPEVDTAWTEEKGIAKLSTSVANVIPTSRFLCLAKPITP